MKPHPKVTEECGKFPSWDISHKDLKGCVQVYGTGGELSPPDFEKFYQLYCYPFTPEETQMEMNKRKMEEATERLIEAQNQMQEIRLRSDSQNAGMSKCIMPTYPILDFHGVWIDKHGWDYYIGADPCILSYKFNKKLLLCL